MFIIMNMVQYCHLQCSNFMSIELLNQIETNKHFSVDFFSPYLFDGKMPKMFFFCVVYRPKRVSSKTD